MKRREKITDQKSSLSLEASTKDRILLTAERLFNEVGVHETGIDRIIAEGGFAKKTFYHHFSSKKQLIEAYLKRRDEIWFERLNRYTQNKDKTDLERFLSIFDALYEWYQEPDFFGCSFIRGLSDFSEEDSKSELSICVQDHFEMTEKLVIELIKPMRKRDYKKWIPSVMSLIAGGTVVAHATRDPKVAMANKAILKQVLESGS